MFRTLIAWFIVKFAPGSFQLSVVSFQFSVFSSGDRERPGQEEAPELSTVAVEGSESVSISYSGVFG